MAQPLSVVWWKYDATICIGIRVSLVVRQQSTAVSEKAENERMALATLFTGNPSILYAFDPVQEQNLACFWAFLDLRELAPTVTITTSLRKASQHRKNQEWHFPYLLILSWEFRRSFSLKCCRMLLRSCKMCSVKLGVLMFLTFSVAPEDCSNDQESYCCGLHSCLCVWSPQDHQTIVHRCDMQVFIHKKMSKLSLSSQDLPYLLHPYLVNASVSLIIPTFFTVFSPLYSRRIVCRSAWPDHLFCSS